MQIGGVPALAAVNSLGGLVYGYIIVGISTTVGYFWPCWYNIYHGTTLNTWEIAIVSSVVNIGAGCGAMGGGPVINFLGRKKGIMLAALICLLGHVGSCFSVVYGMQVFFRIIVGVGGGMSTAACPAYVAEMAPDNYRGTLNSLFQVCITIGIFLANFVGYFVAGPRRNVHGAHSAIDYCEGGGTSGTPMESYTSGHSLGQNLALLLPGVIFPLGLAILAMVVPESNKWLAERGERDPLKLTGGDEAPAAKGSIADLFTIHRKAAVIGIVMCCALQLTGINAVMFYATAFFTGAGIKQLLLASMLLMLWNCVTTFISLFLVDRAGRRLLLIPSVLVLSLSIIGLDIVTLTEPKRAAFNFVPGPPAMVIPPTMPTAPVPSPSAPPMPPPVSMKIATQSLENPVGSQTDLEEALSTLVKFAQGPEAVKELGSFIAVPGAPMEIPAPPKRVANGAQSAFSIIFLVLYIAAFEIGPGCLFWVIVNEIFDPSIASTAGGIFNALMWVMTLFITLTFPPLKSGMGSNVFLLYGIPGILCTLFLFFCLPETKGKDISQISEDLQSRWIVWPDRGYTAKKSINDESENLP
eukprot:TRINITY_DN57161_c0_g1_i1.p1 TRINITY_DN57161_c0_g1~~TRINITY_DN57161_c0_g1_i1.p1  ORF type:complete len:582 (+),score=32.73 TRINITY_DN57161_c0_g1_i1:21-1766(+)